MCTYRAYAVHIEYVSAEHCCQAEVFCSCFIANFGAIGCKHDLHGYPGARCWIPRPLLHRDDDSVLAKLFWGGTRPLGYLLVPLGCDYLFLRYHYQVLSPPSVGALKWMFTSFKVSLSSAKPNQQLTQYPLVKWGLYSWTPDSQTHTWNEKCFVPSWLGTYN